MHAGEHEREDTVETLPLSEVEHIKEASRGLRGPLLDELAQDSSHFSEEAKQVLKFHGSYQQEDRDARRERKRAGLEPAWQFMVRSRIPGGVLTAEQYLAHDDLASRFANGTLRVTTRQDIQLHGVIKRDLRETIRSLNDALVTTLGACGDVQRNIVTCPAPLEDGLRARALEAARQLSAHLLPRTRAYHEIWLNGEQVAGGEPEDDPLYGERYLPRKFKTALGFAQDNCTDLQSNDLGFLVVEEDGELAGFNVLVGGGLGRTHGKADTYPRLATPLGFVRPDRLLDAATAVVLVQRDYGNRGDRRRARLKYLLDERGIDWFRAQVESRMRAELEPPREIRITGIHDHLGWHEQRAGVWFLGLFIENGRIRDTETSEARAALRRIAQEIRPGVRLTPQQNLLFTDIPESQRARVDGILAEHGVRPVTQLSHVRRWSMACPALPTCGLAVAESERALPGVIDALEVELRRLGLDDLPFTVRMTGCPNGCARPWTADLAFVGRSLGKYQIAVGGNLEGTRLARPWADLVPLDRLVDAVRPLLERYRERRHPGERFGDYFDRAGEAELEELRAAAGERKPADA